MSCVRFPLSSPDANLQVLLEFASAFTSSGSIVYIHSVTKLGLIANFRGKCDLSSTIISEQACCSGHGCFSEQLLSAPAMCVCAGCMCADMGVGIFKCQMSVWGWTERGWRGEEAGKNREDECRSVMFPAKFNFL